MLTIRQISSDDEVAAADALVREFTDWAFSLEPDAERAPIHRGLDRELSDLSAAYAPPDGCFLLATIETRPVGCIAFRPVDGETVELKRMYVRPEQRGQGVGKGLVAEAIAQARSRGKRRIVLDSLSAMRGAQDLCRAAGFTASEPPADALPEPGGRVVSMVLDLDATARG